MSTRQPETLNAFSAEYLDAVKQHDEPSTALEADTAGPFSLVEQEGMLALFRSWESRERGDVPQALFRDRETALLFQAIWPAVGRNRLFHLRTSPAAGGFELEQEGELVGSLHNFVPDAVLGGHFASYLTRMPWSLALLLEACGPTAQRHIGQLLGARLLGR
ncbi:MAG TPA: hypothetical protein VF173_15695 [Thermoanaerobaculia bacterium]|nr:hypothetical protein [Thermoanaerobaculia bacterium]